MMSSLVFVVAVWGIWSLILLLEVCLQLRRIANSLALKQAEGAEQGR